MPVAMSGSLDNAIRQEQDQRIERIERGKQAVMAASFIIEPIMASREKALRRMINAYRGGTVTHDMLLGGIAEITALDNLITELNNAQTQGEIAAEQEFRNGQR